MEDALALAGGRPVHREDVAVLQFVECDAAAHFWHREDEAVVGHELLARAVPALGLRAVEGEAENLSCRTLENLQALAEALFFAKANHAGVSHPGGGHVQAHHAAQYSYPQPPLAVFAVRANGVSGVKLWQASFVLPRFSVPADGRNPGYVAHIEAGRRTRRRSQTVASLQRPFEARHGGRKCVAPDDLDAF